jgi:hypothetical protein
VNVTEGFSTVEGYAHPDPAVESLQRHKSETWKRIDLVISDLAIAAGEDRDGLKVVSAATDAGVPCVVLYTTEALVKDGKRTDLGEGKFGRGWKVSDAQSSEKRFVLPGGVHVVQGGQDWSDDVEKFVRAEFFDYKDCVPKGLPDGSREAIAELARLAHVNVFGDSFPRDASIVFQRYEGGLQAGASWSVVIKRVEVLKEPSSTLFVPVLRFKVHRDTFDPGSLSSNLAEDSMEINLGDGSVRDPTCEDFGAKLSKASKYFEYLRRQENLYVQKCRC